MKVTSFENLLKVSVPQREAGEQYVSGTRVGGGIKNEIQGISAQSKYNLAKQLSRTKWPLPPVHVSLTYGKNFPPAKEDLRAIQMFLNRRDIWGYWRLEYQERDAPHYHLLLSHLLESTEKDFSSWWEEKTENWSGHGFCVTRRDAAKAAWYLALHATKDDQSPKWKKVGRWWGYIQGQKVKENQTGIDLGSISKSQNRDLCRFIRRLTKGKLNVLPGQSFSAFLPQEFHMQILKYLYEKEPF